MSTLSAPHFHDEAAAIAKLESIVWPDGPVCPHCGHEGESYEIKGVRTKPSKKHPKGLERHGLRACKECRKQFTVKIGTLFEDSPIPVHKWWQAIHLLCSSKKGISSHQLHRTLQVTYKTAWFMAHRIREAMRTDGLAPPMGSGGSIVEVDATFIGRKKGIPVPPAGFRHKQVALTLIDRKGEARSFQIEDTRARNIVPIVKANIAKEARFVTDEAKVFVAPGRVFARHERLNHLREEWARGEFHTNTVEGYFSLFKRGMRGVYQHCSEKHLHRYLAEFDFRYNNRTAKGIDDAARTNRAVSGIKGKRLRYRDSSVPADRA